MILLGLSIRPLCAKARPRGSDGYFVIARIGDTISRQRNKAGALSTVLIGAPADESRRKRRSPARFSGAGGVWSGIPQDRCRLCVRSAPRQACAGSSFPRRRGYGNISMRLAAPVARLARAIPSTSWSGSQRAGRSGWKYTARRPERPRDFRNRFFFRRGSFL